MKTHRPSRRSVLTWAMMLVVVPAALIVSTAPRADAATPEDEAAAEMLFREGKRLLADGKAAEACPRLQQSYALDPGGGTLLMLAVCHEAEGKTATAWNDFNEAASIAKRDGRIDRVTIANDRATSLLPRLCRLRLRVRSRPAPSRGEDDDALIIFRDGVRLERVAWNVAVPVDPGEHVISVVRSGTHPFRKVVNVSGEGAIVDVDTDADVDLGGKEGSLFDTRETAESSSRTSSPTPMLTTTTTTTTTSKRTPPLRWVGLGIGGLAVLGLGAGVFLGLDAKSKLDDANTRCPTTTCKDADGVRLSQEGGTRADMSTAAFVVGATCAVTAVILILVSYKRQNQQRQPPHMAEQLLRGGLLNL